MKYFHLYWYQFQQDEGRRQMIFPWGFDEQDENIGTKSSFKQLDLIRQCDADNMIAIVDWVYKFIFKMREFWECKNSFEKPEGGLIYTRE